MDRVMKNVRNVRETLFSQQSMVVVQTQSTSDDVKVIQQILAAHSPDANFNVNEQVLLNIAQDILNKANPTFPPLVSTLKVLLYSLGRGKAPLLDIIVYAGYTFMGISLAILVGNFSRYPYYIVLTGLCICMGFFLVKTMKMVLFAEIMQRSLEMRMNTVYYMTPQNIISTIEKKDPKTDPKVSEEGISEELALTIHKIGCELSCNCSSGGDMKLITAAVFDKLKKFSWEDKLVIALLAFVINYGEFCLPSQLHNTNPLAKYLFQFKSFLCISGQETLISNLLKVVIAMAKSIIKLNELHSRYPQYISQDKYPFSQAEISIDVYWAIKGIVACSSQSTGLGKEYWGMITEACMKLVQILNNRHQKLTDISDQCSKVIMEKINEEAYYKLKEFMRRTHTDNMEVLINLIHTNDNRPLFQRDTNKKVSLNVLQSKMVILFFSYIDISVEEIKEIEQQIWETGQKRYEIVWLPVLYNYKQEISDEMKEVIDQKARLMPWYSLHYSSTLHPCVIKYIKKHWKFERKPLLVAFKEGAIVNDSCNVYDMIMTWGTKAYPFDARTEKELWMTSKWGLEIFIDQKSENKGKLIYFYGGDDLGWIRNFLSSMKEVVKGDRDGFKLIYVGKKHRETINNESLSEWWDDQKIMGFWARMHSILYSKMKFGGSIDNDQTFKDVLTLLGCEGSGRGWAMIGHESDHLVALNGETITEWLAQLKIKKVQITRQNFFIKLGEFIPRPPAMHCNHIYVTSTNGIIQENMVCVDCGRLMEKKVMFSCCKN